MTIMKKFIFCILLPFLFISCTQEITQKTASVTFDISVDCNEETKVSEVQTDEDKIKSLRVIVKLLNSGETIVNKKYNYTEGVTGTSINLQDLPIGPAQFYFYANEDMIGGLYNGEGIDAALVEDNGLTTVEPGSKLVLKDENEIFPLDNVPQFVPMFSKCVLNVDKSNSNFHVKLSRNYIKYNVKIDNTTDRRFKLNKIYFGKIFPNAMYLFPDETYKFPPYGSLGITEPFHRFIKEFPDGYYIEKANDANDNFTFAIYSFPTDAGLYAKNAGIDNPFVIAFDIGETPVQEQDLVYHRIMFDDNWYISTIPSNSQVNIEAAIRSESQVSLTFSLSNWFTNKFEVPPFN